MAAGGKAHDADTAGVEFLARGQPPHHAQRALRVLQRRLRAGRPPVGGQAVEEDEADIARLRETAGDGIAFMADGDAQIAAAGEEQHGRAIGLGPHRFGPQHGEGGGDDMGEHAIVRAAVRAAQRFDFPDRHAIAAGRLARPDREAREARGQGEALRARGRREGGAGECPRHDRAAVEVDHRHWHSVRPSGVARVSAGRCASTRAETGRLSAFNPPATRSATCRAPSSLKCVSSLIPLGKAGT